MSKYETVKTNKYIDAKPKSMVIEKRATNEPVQNKYFQKVISPSTPYNSMQKSAIIQKDEKGGKELPPWVKALKEFAESMVGTPEERKQILEMVSKYVPDLRTVTQYPELMRAISGKGIQGSEILAAINERNKRGDKIQDFLDTATSSAPASSSPSRVVSETPSVSSPTTAAEIAAASASDRRVSTSGISQSRKKRILDLIDSFNLTYYDTRIPELQRKQKTQSIYENLVKSINDWNLVSNNSEIEAAISKMPDYLVRRIEYATKNYMPQELRSDAMQGLFPKTRTVSETSLPPPPPPDAPFLPKLRTSTSSIQRNEFPNLIDLINKINRIEKNSTIPNVEKKKQLQSGYEKLINELPSYSELIKIPALYRAVQSLPVTIDATLKYRDTNGISPEQWRNARRNFLENDAFDDLSRYSFVHPLDPNLKSYNVSLKYVNDDTAYQSILNLNEKAPTRNDNIPIPSGYIYPGVRPPPIGIPANRQIVYANEPTEFELAQDKLLMSQGYSPIYGELFEPASARTPAKSRMDVLNETGYNPFSVHELIPYESETSSVSDRRRYDLVGNRFGSPSYPRNAVNVIAPEIVPESQLPPYRGVVSETELPVSQTENSPNLLDEIIANETGLNEVLNHGKTPGIRYSRFGINPEKIKRNPNTRKTPFAVVAPEYDPYDMNMLLPENFSANNIPYGSYNAKSEYPFIDEILNTKGRKVSETGDLNSVDATDILNEITASYSAEDVARLQDQYGPDWHKHTGINSHLPESGIPIVSPGEVGVSSLGGKTPKTPIWDKSRKTINTRFDPLTYNDDYISGYPSEQRGVKKMNNTKDKRKLQ